MSDLILGAEEVKAKERIVEYLHDEHDGYRSAVAEGRNVEDVHRSVLVLERALQKHAELCTSHHMELER
ncbi:MAG: hypothetical protein KDB27_16390 [Planctomycetales bacterium]|nr:hypothetical protein [Planctomycetales bacterium]